MSGTDDREMEDLKAVSCAVLLERQAPPYTLDKSESTRNCLKYRRGKGEIILVTHGGRGWWDPGSRTAKGDIFNLVQHLHPGLNFGQARKALREFVGIAPPLKPHPGEAYQRLTSLLQRTIAQRYHLPAWDQESYLMHKRADRLAAISEARHVAGWSLDEIMEEFGSIGVLTVDPLQGPGPLPPIWQPWEPWPPDLAARMFLDRLRGLSNTARRGRTLSDLANAFANASPAIRRHCKTSVHGDPARDHLVRVEAPDGEAWEGVIVAGEIERDGAWALDAKFLIFTTDERPEGQLITVFGWECDAQPI